MFSNLSFNIKSKALELGFQKIGIAQAVSTPVEKANLDTWIQKGQHGSMEWIVKRQNERGDIFEYFPGAKSVISVGMNYYSGHDQNDLQSEYKLSNYAWGDD